MSSPSRSWFFFLSAKDIPIFYCCNTPGFGTLPVSQIILLAPCPFNWSWRTQIRFIKIARMRWFFPRCAVECNLHSELMSSTPPPYVYLRMHMQNTREPVNRQILRILSMREDDSWDSPEITEHHFFLAYWVNFNFCSERLFGYIMGTYRLLLVLSLAIIGQFSLANGKLRASCNFNF